MPKVSIIISCYNVENYMDKCLESVVNQTLSDIEILLINDGSTDGTMAKCEEWAEKDGRIRLFSQKNRGLSATRNRGIKAAESDYVMFIDPDDYVDVTMAEKMYKSVSEYDCDLSFCGFCEFFSNKPDTHSFIEPILREPTSVFEAKELFMNIYPIMCNKIIKKQIIIENDIVFPEGFVSEDQYFSRMVFLKAKKINQVPEVLYYYNRANESSISKNPYAINDSIAVLEMLISYMKKNDLFDLFYDELIGIVSRRLRSAINLFQFHKDKSFDEELTRAGSFYCGTFGFDKRIENIKIGIFGSYNSKASLQTLMINHKNISFHYMNSGIISVTGKARGFFDKSNIYNENGFRRQCVYDDINKSFVSRLESGEKPDYIMLDFLEDRFDILKTNTGIITESQAFLTSEIKNVSVLNRLPFGSGEMLEKWKESCVEFIELLKRYYPENKIIINEVYLSCYYGTMEFKTPFENCEEIAKKNEVLKGCYDFVKAKFKGLRTISVDEGLRYCYICHLYGIAPEHQNAMAYIKTARLLHDIIANNQ